VNKLKQKMLITGISGALSKRLCFNFKDDYHLSGFSRDEHKAGNVPDYVSREIGCQRDFDRVDQIFNKYKPDIVIATGSLKKVDDIQRFPMEAVKTNILGTYNVCRACDKHNVKKMIFTNTDKAGGGATTMYGATKLLAGGICDEWNGYSDTIFSKVLYGNILGSTSSAIPMFIKMVENNQTIQLTHPEVTRFFFTIDDSVNLIKDAIELGVGGDTFIPIMKSYKIIDVLKAISTIIGKSFKYNISGWRGVEKLHESFLTPEEMSRTYYIRDDLVCVTPPNTRPPHYAKKKYDGPMLSSNIMLSDNIDELVELIKYGLSQVE